MEDFQTTDSFLKQLLSDIATATIVVTFFIAGAAGITAHPERMFGPQLLANIQSALLVALGLIVLAWVVIRTFVNIQSLRVSRLIGIPLALVLGILIINATVALSFVTICQVGQAFGLSSCGG